MATYLFLTISVILLAIAADPAVSTKGVKRRLAFIARPSTPRSTRLPRFQLAGSETQASEVETTAMADAESTTTTTIGQDLTPRVVVDKHQEECYRTPLIANGFARSGGSRPGDRRQIMCNDGFYIKGEDSYVTCGWDGAWSYTATCVRMCTDGDQACVPDPMDVDTRVKPTEEQDNTLTVLIIFVVILTVVLIVFMVLFFRPYCIASGL